MYPLGKWRSAPSVHDSFLCHTKKQAPSTTTVILPVSLSPVLVDDVNMEDDDSMDIGNPYCGVKSAGSPEPGMDEGNDNCDISSTASVCLARVYLKRMMMTLSLTYSVFLPHPVFFQQ